MEVLLEEIDRFIVGGTFPRHDCERLGFSVLFVVETEILLSGVPRDGQVSVDLNAMCCCAPKTCLG